MKPLGSSSLHFEFQGNRFCLAFRHERATQPVFRFDLESGFTVKPEICPTGGSTICTLYEVLPKPENFEGDWHGRVPLTFSIAVCSKKDHFNKRVGRHISFARLLENLELVNAYISPAVKEFGEVLRERGTIGFPSRQRP